MIIREIGEGNGCVVIYKVMSLDMMSLAVSSLGRYLISPRNGRDLIFMIDSNIESLMTRENDIASAVEMSTCKQYCISLKDEKQDERVFSE